MTLPVRFGHAWIFFLALCWGTAWPGVVWATRADARPLHAVATAAVQARTDTGHPPGEQTRRGLPRNSPWRQIIVRSGDSLSKIFARLGLKAAAWRSILQTSSRADALRHLHPGDVIHIRKTPADQLLGLRYSLNKLDTLVVEGNNHGLNVQIQTLPTQTRWVVVAGKVRHSLPKSLTRAGVPPGIASQLARLYAPRLDLSNQIQSDDRFSIVYKIKLHERKRVAIGPIVAARITAGGHAYPIFRALDARGQPHYYDASGRSWTPAISRHPANYTRISSSFSLHRMDPAVHFVHPHYGVDMAAPAGTPVHAAAEGMVKFVGRARGYGKLVELRHSDGYTTRYAHLDRFARHLHDGQHVAQGEKIGTVGNTGWSTGPHLLFEIRKNGVPHNPMTMPLPDGQPLDNQRRARFKRRIRALIVQLDHPRAGSITLTSLVVAPGCRRFAQLNARLALDPAAYKLEQLPQNFLCLLRGPLRNHRAPLASKPQSKRPVFE